MILRFVICLFLYLSTLYTLAQKPKVPAGLNLAGKFQKVKGKELLVLNKDNSFYCLINYKQKTDAIIPRCDTLALGFWSQQNDFIVLKNRADFNLIKYSIIESEQENKDSLYFKITLPVDDTIDYKIFNFSLNTSPMFGQYNTFSKREFAIPNKGLGVTYELTLKNIAPNSDYGKKSYQRIYFNVFESYRPQKSTSNFFSIIIHNFNKCFYQAMDINGEIIGIDGDSLFWREGIYKKISN